MRLSRRRNHSAYPSDVLGCISTLLTEFRVAFPQEQLVSRAVTLLLELVPADAALVLGYPSGKGRAEILHAYGLWISLAGNSAGWERIRSSEEAAEQRRDAPIGKMLEQGGHPIQLWNAPLRAHDRILGSLWLGRVTEESPGFSEDEIRAAEIIADIVAGMLLQFSLDERIKRQQSQLRAMHSVERAITSSVDLDITIKVYLDQVTDQLQADAAMVLLLDPKTRDLIPAGARGFRKNDRPPSRMRADHDLASLASLERKVVSRTAAKPDDPLLTQQPIMREEEFLAYYAAPLIAHGQVKGVLEVFRRTAGEADSNWLEILESLALQGAIVIDTAETFREFQRTHSELSMACDATIEGWSRAVDLRAKETEGHSLRVSSFAIRTAEKMGLPPDQMLSLRRGALLHDIGKLGIPDRILWKDDALSEEEWQLMRQHPKFAEQLLAPIDFLRPAMDIPKFHHERWDGSGYPYRLSGTDIPIAARIFSVVDVWDSLQSHRPFREAWSASDTVDYLNQSSGKLFDPEVVQTFLQVLRGS